MATDEIEAQLRSSLSDHDDDGDDDDESLSSLPLSPSWEDSSLPPQPHPKSRLGCCGCRASSPSRKSFHPTLSLLSTPWEYFVTIDQSALWQKHIAWAKPRGSDLKAYISSQYSSRMVLLSLLLATEMSVFFSSSPTISSLRQTLNIWQTHHDSNGTNEDLGGSVLPFWIGFFLLLNICVTISGILATFASWNVVSAISDANAHCLLRSSLGQYVATLSPRLVVTSLYLFLLWFLLFVVELIFGGESRSNTGMTVAHAKEYFRELFTQHLPLVLLWACFLGAVVALFFSIVVPLSAFGRLVQHTGAMAEPPVLSESLQVELLPRGLHAGLVIKAHHSQQRGTAVTRQYTQRRKQQQQKRRQRKRSRQCKRNTSQEEVLRQQRQQQQDSYCRSPRLYNSNNNHIRQIASPPLTSRVAVAETMDDLGGARKSHFREEESSNDNEDEMASSVALTRFGQDLVASSPRISVSSGSLGSDEEESNNASVTKRNWKSTDTNHENQWKSQTRNHDLGDEPKDSFRKRKHARERSSRFAHRRLATTETMASLNLPPAAILNLSMTAKEFHDIIDSAIDTSSLCNIQSPIDMDMTAGMGRPLYSCGGDDGRENGGGNHQTKATVKASRKRHSGRRGSKHKSGIPLSPYCRSPATAQAADGPTLSSQSRNPSSRSHYHHHQHQDLVTRHHRRVSSSRFLLQEWAQENRVRDLYGAAPPADLPQEIAWRMLETKENPCGQEDTLWQDESPSSNSTTRNAAIVSSELHPSRNPPKQQQQQQQHHRWWLSPFSSPFGSFHRIPNQNTNPSLRNPRVENDFGVRENANHENHLKEPLLPDITSFRDEELGVGGIAGADATAAASGEFESSELLGEGLLISDGDNQRRRNGTLMRWTPRNTQRRGIRQQQESGM